MPIVYPDAHDDNVEIYKINVCTLYTHAGASMALVIPVAVSRIVALSTGGAAGALPGGARPRL